MAGFGNSCCLGWVRNYKSFQGLYANNGVGLQSCPRKFSGTVDNYVHSDLEEKEVQLAWTHGCLSRIYEDLSSEVGRRGLSCNLSCGPYWNTWRR